MLLFPRPSALKDIYCDPKCNTKSSVYGSGALGPPHLFSTLDGDAHKSLRKALAGPQWSVGSLKTSWESRIDDQVRLFIHKMNERAETKDEVVLSDKVAEFAADIMTMLTFTEPWGFVKNGRDERSILTNWRRGLDYLGFASRFTFFRNHIMKAPLLSSLLLPRTNNESGMGWLMAQADREVTQRDKELENGIHPDRPDFLQYCLDAQMDGESLNPTQKRAHVTLMIQAGADTTGTALGSTLRFLVMHPEVLATARKEINMAEREGRLSTPVKFEEVRGHLPYFVACIKESLRLNPPAPNLFARIVPEAGKFIDGVFVPGGAEITSNAFVVQRDPKMYDPDPDTYRPERWLESAKKANEMDAASFVFGIGPRVCLGKEIAIMELYKLLPETVRRFEIKLIREGRYIVAGGVGYNQDFTVKLTARG